MNILDKIIATKKREVAHKQLTVTISTLESQPMFERQCNSLKKNLTADGSSGIIAEFKQKSPSKGVLNSSVQVGQVSKAYAAAGAAGISVLTDSEYFGGSLENLLNARTANPAIPLLRKDFMIDAYQIVEAKAHGADVILLIAACLEKKQVKQLAKLAKQLGMEVLLEIHNEKELAAINEFVDMVGVNNRNLKTFEVNIDTSLELAPLIPDTCLKISESGLKGATEISQLRNAGFKGFLIGETFMRTNDPGRACKLFIDGLCR